MDGMIPTIGLDILQDSIIKVLGVGGGGCNAVNYMYRQGIRDVSFLVCNTDSMALEKMSVPAKLQIGPGLGAGGRPQVAEDFAQGSEERIREALDDGTKMVFITAGMGGGTGTGASPVVAKVAHEMGILTVGIVTIPFAFEGRKAIQKAMRGVAKLAQYTDALLVINNEKLRLLFSDLDLPNAFSKADEVLCNAAKSIAEIITIPGYINTDFQDVYNTLKDGNVAIMNVGEAEGEDRITKAIEDALTSPLVNTNDVHGASRILLNFYCSTEHAIRMQELAQVQEFCDSVGDDVDVKWGASYDETLGEKVKVTIIATGYSVTDIPGLDAALQEEDPKPQEKKEPTKSIDDSIAAFYPESDKQASAEKKEEEKQSEKDSNKESKSDEDTIIIEDADDDFSRIKEEKSDAQEVTINRPVESDSPTTDTIKFDENDSSEVDIEKIPAWKRWRMKRK